MEQEIQNFQEALDLIDEIKEVFDTPDEGEVNIKVDPISEESVRVTKELITKIYQDCQMIPGQISPEADNGFFVNYFIDKPEPAKPYKQILMQIHENKAKIYYHLRINSAKAKTYKTTTIYFNSKDYMKEVYNIFNIAITPAS